MTHKKQSDRMKALWKDPEYRARMSKSNKHPSKKQRNIRDRLKYTGRFRVLVKDLYILHDAFIKEPTKERYEATIHDVNEMVHAYKNVLTTYCDKYGGKK